MPDIATSSLIALSAFTPAAIFSYLGLGKYGTRLHIPWPGNTPMFDVNSHQMALDNHVKQHFKTQLNEPVILNIGGKRMKFFIRQSEFNQFTFYINYNVPVISLQNTGNGWLLVDEEIKCPGELATHFILTLEKRLFS